MPKVIVWGTQIEVSVHQKSKTVWLASGTYMGENFTVKSQTQGAAIKAWADAAKYRGN